MRVRAAWRHDTSKAAEPRAKLSRRGLRWALEGVVYHRLTLLASLQDFRLVEHRQRNGLGKGNRLLFVDPDRFDGVSMGGVDEHVWRNTRREGEYVTVIIELTDMRHGTRAARLLDTVEGRSNRRSRHG